MTRARMATPITAGVFALLLAVSALHAALADTAPVLKNRAEIDKLIMGSNAGVLIRAGVTGAAELLVDIDEQGRVVGRQLVQATGNSIIDGVLLDVARRMTFAPATQDGTPVRASAKVPFVFAS